MSFATIAAELESAVETVLGADTLILDAVTIDTLKIGEGVLIALDYTIEELDFLQDRITYPFTMVFKRGGGDDSETNRAAFIVDLESIHTAIQADPTLSGNARDTRITNLIVQSGPQQNEILGILELSAVVVT